MSNNFKDAHTDSKDFFKKKKENYSHLHFNQLMPNGTKAKQVAIMKQDKYYASLMKQKQFLKVEH